MSTCQQTLNMERSHHQAQTSSRQSKYAPKFYFEVIFTEVEYPEDDHEQDAAAEDDGEGGVPPGVTTVIYNNDSSNLLLTWVSVSGTCG